MTNESQDPKRNAETPDSSDLTRRQALKLALGVALAMAPVAALAEGGQRRPKMPVGNTTPNEYVPGGSEYVDPGSESSGDKEENEGSSTPKPLLPSRSPYKYPSKKTP
jgi:hypothetical protein